MSDLRERVRERYAAAARSVQEGEVADDWHSDVSCCEADCCGHEHGMGVQLYDATERSRLPDEAVLASLGCGVDARPERRVDLAWGARAAGLGAADVAARRAGFAVSG